MVTRRLFIKRVSDGEIRPSKWENNFSYFWWNEGNGSCDCNRSIAFGDPEHIKCSETKYELVDVNGDPFENWDQEEFDGGV